MKFIKALLIFLFFINNSYATMLKNETNACFIEKSNKKWHIENLKNQPLHINEEDKFLEKYNAEYFSNKGKKYGILTLEKNNSEFNILIYKKIFDPKKLILLSNTKKPKELIKPNISLSFWKKITSLESKKNYICIYDNFDGIGRSGKMQNYVYLYLIDQDKDHIFYTELHK